MFIVYYATSVDCGLYEAAEDIKNATGYTGVLDGGKAADQHIQEYTENVVKAAQTVDMDIPLPTDDLVEIAKHMYVFKSIYNEEDGKRQLAECMDTGKVPEVQFRAISGGVSGPTIAGWMVWITV